MTNAPRWAIALRDEVSIAEGIAPPVLKWRRSSLRTPGAGGTYGAEGHSVTVTVYGRPDRTEVRIVLLHEMAHAITPRSNHGPEFWDAAWRLYLRYRLPVRRVIDREAHYKAECIPAGRRAGVRIGAATEAKAAAKRRRKDGHTCKPKPRSRKVWRLYGWYRPCYACSGFVSVTD